MKMHAYSKTQDTRRQVYPNTRKRVSPIDDEHDECTYSLYARLKGKPCFLLFFLIDEPAKKTLQIGLFIKLALAPDPASYGGDG